MNKLSTAHNVDRHEHVGIAIAARIGVTISFAVMAACVKLASHGGANAPEILFYRQLGSLPLIFAWVLMGPGLASVRSNRPRAHIIRAVIGVVCMAVMFLAIEMLPLAEWTALSFASPLFATILAVVLLREHVGFHRWTAIIVGFLGVIVMTRSNAMMAVPPLGVAVGLLGAFLGAVVVITVRQLGGTEPPTRIVFWFAVQATAVTAIAMPWYAQSHDAVTWALLVGVGLFGGLVQILMALSLHYAPVGTTAPFDYLQLIWAALLGWLIWSELPDARTIGGAVLIAAAGLYTFHREHVHRRGIAATGGPLG